MGEQEIQDKKTVYERLARGLPDIPRWLETRSMLLDGEAEVLGLEPGDDSSFIVRHLSTHLISIIGRPAPEAVREAIFRNNDRGVAICQLDDEEYVRPLIAGWNAGPATLHLLGDSARLPLPEYDQVRFIGFQEVAATDDIPESLKDELRTATLWSPLAATMVDDKPVSFCYVASETETLWDISIDTLEPYRRMGYASLAVAAMIEHMHQKRKRPVWGAEESNVASMALARRLGFVPVDRLVVFTRA